MIEVQIKNEELFNKFKQMASYSSELTGICSFNENMLELLESNGVLIDQNQIKEKQQAIITMNGNVMEVKNSTPEILAFLGNKSETDYEISVFYMDRVHMLILAGILEPDEKFKNFYSRVEDTDDLSILLYGNKRLQGENAYEIFKEKLDKETITLADCPFTEEDYRTKDLSYVTDEVTFTSNLELNSNGKGYFVEAVSKNGRKYYITFYIRPTGLQRLIMYKGGSANIAFTSSRSQGVATFISSPEILPEGFNMKLVKMYTPYKRIPKVNTWRALFYEYKYRKSLNAKNMINRNVRGLTKLAEEGVFE